MKIKIQVPSSMEVSDVTAAETGLTLSPVAVKGQHLLRVGYLVATGDNGGESKAVLVFNGNTGEFMVQKINKAAAPLAFDSLKPDEFDNKKKPKPPESATPPTTPKPPAQAPLKPVAGQEAGSNA